jgi:carbon-monoxide dehydrogenase large subunit
MKQTYMKSREQDRLLLLGQNLKRQEDPDLLRGNRTFTDDIKFQDQLYASIVRSPYAHAKITSIDFSKATSDARVVLALSGSDVFAKIAPLPIIFAFHGTRLPKQPCLAHEGVRFVGEPVAIIVAKDRGTAEDASDNVRVEYSALDPIIDPLKAVETEDRIVYDSVFESGNVESAFKGATYKVSRTIVTHRLNGAAMEPRSVLAKYDPTEGFLSVWSSSQIPFMLRDVLSECLNLEKSKIRVLVPQVGGSFGNYKYHAEDVIVSYCSMLLGKPVKWTADRREIFLGNYHAREQIHDIALAADDRGNILALKDSIIADHGAYLTREGVGPSLITALMITGPYRIRNVSVRLRCVLTNKTPTGAYRGFGHPESCFALERILDALADEMKISRVDLRSRNFIQPEEFPYETPTGLTYDSGNYARCMVASLEAIGYDRRSEVKRRRSSENEKKRIGFGFACFTENTGFGPTTMLDSLGVRQFGFERATAHISQKDHKVIIRCGMAPHGQGSETTLAQVVAGSLELPIDMVKVEYGDTLSCPEGQGTFASRSSVVGSGLMLKLAKAFLERGKVVAKRIFNTEEIRYEKGFFYNNSSPNACFSWFDLDVASRAFSSDVVDVTNDDKLLKVTIEHEPDGLTFSNACHAAMVEVDIETGKVRPLKYVIVHDCGVEINPMIVEGQAHGGAVQGISGALLEGIPYTNEGEPLASSFLDYLIATSLDVPDITVLRFETPSLVNPLGVKGVGEGGVIAPAATIASAIEDALREDKPNANVLQSMLVPEFVWRISRQG